MNIGKLLTLTAITLSVALASCETPPQDSAATDASGATDSSSGYVSQPVAAAPPPPASPAPYPAFGSGVAYWDEGRDRYTGFDDNPLKQVARDPVSTFSIDVDTASYSIVRRYLKDGVMPPADAIRTEEMLNYFDYAYPLPKNRDEPFRADIAVFDTPWDEGTALVRIGLQGYDIPANARPPANLVFLVDTSGSMHSPDKLPLVKRSLRMLAQKMNADDRIAIVAYAGSAGIVLEPTPAAKMAKILTAIDRLQSGGSTAGGAGIQLAYSLAGQNFRDGAANRVILATDGDFNVGISDPDALEDLIAGKRKTGIYLTVLGFGQGNLHDNIMQKLAQAGNGNAAYIDSYNEARKVLVDEMGSTLIPIADDVKIQVEFNPAYVAEYRLIGYETRMLKREDFNNDQVDAGEVGSGHSVTALYEITPVGGKSRLIDPLRYGEVAPVEKAGVENGELAWLRVRYKRPGEAKSHLMEQPISQSSRTSFADAPADARFAAAVAGFAQLLRGNANMGAFTIKDVIRIAGETRGKDEFGYRAEFQQLVRAAAGMPKFSAAR